MTDQWLKRYVFSLTFLSSLAVTTMLCDASLVGPCILRHARKACLRVVWNFSVKKENSKKLVKPWRPSPIPCGANIAKLIAKKVRKYAVKMTFMS